jgi:hypothetical protein
MHCPLRRPPVANAPETARPASAANDRMTGSLPVRPGGRVKLEPSVVADEVFARLLKVDGFEIETVGRRLEVRRLSPRRWAVELLRDLGEAEVLDVFHQVARPARRQERRRLQGRPPPRLSRRVVSGAIAGRGAGVGASCAVRGSAPNR